MSAILLIFDKFSERMPRHPGHISESLPPNQSSCPGIQFSGALFHKFSISTLSLFSQMFAKMFVFVSNVRFGSLFVYFLFHFISFLGKYH